jgi:hypothetical protein
VGFLGWRDTRRPFDLRDAISLMNVSKDVVGRSNVSQSIQKLTAADMRLSLSRYKVAIVLWRAVSDQNLGVFRYVLPYV